ncbi:MAG: hypothetical protein JO154_08590 [Chitinophaga sp.]|uniref:hypothetical protein n=1 Tax=Chitinophaga sp. TaxID=1869181 RepID=UPI0025BFEE4C|nr:hypothetical protein [Chitinophaga sp.]MBV8252651.1 hypothetical protein [Chitinophaga sp.]
MQYLLILALHLFMPNVNVNPPTCSDTLQFERVKLDGVGCMMTGGAGDQSLTVASIDFDKKDTILLTAVIYRNNAVYKKLEGYSYADFLDDNTLIAVDPDGHPWRYHLATQQREKYITDLPIENISGPDLNVRKWKGALGLMVRMDSAVLFQGVQEQHAKKILQLQQLQGLNKDFNAIVSFDVYGDKILTVLKSNDEGEDKTHFEVCYWDGSKASSLYHFTAIGDGDAMPVARFAGADQYFLSFNEMWGRIQLNSIQEKKVGPLFCTDSALVKNMAYQNGQLYCELMTTIIPPTEQTMAALVRATFSRVNIHKVLNKFDIKRSK